MLSLLRGCAQSSGHKPGIQPAAWTFSVPRFSRKVTLVASSYMEAKRRMERAYKGFPGADIYLVDVTYL